MIFDVRLGSSIGSLSSFSTGSRDLLLTMILLLAEKLWIPGGSDRPFLPSFLVDRVEGAASASGAFISTQSLLFRRGRRFLDFDRSLVVRFCEELRDLWCPSRGLDLDRARRFGEASPWVEPLASLSRDVFASPRRLLSRVRDFDLVRALPDFLDRSCRLVSEVESSLAVGERLRSRPFEGFPCSRDTSCPAILIDGDADRRVCLSILG